jgi:hypothetical protein
MTTGTNPPDESPSPDELPDDELEDRVPCPDGACIGVIGPDGRCTECRRPGAPAGEAGGDDDLDDGEVGDDLDEGFEDDDLDDADEGPGDDEPADCGEPGGDDDDRTPCPDGACIGIIGPDGRCTECGRTADADRSAEADRVEEPKGVEEPEDEKEPEDGEEP